MKFEGQRTYPAESETLRLLFHDPVALRAMIPGCQSLEATGPNDYQLLLTLRLGQTIETFDGTLTVDESSAGDINLRAAGMTAGTAVTARGRLALDRLPDGQTSVIYEAEAAADSPSPLSARMLQTTGRAFVRRCLEGLDRQVAIRTRTYTTAPPAPVATAPAVVDRQRAIMWRRLSFVAIVALLALLLGRGISRRACDTGDAVGGSAG
jgi:carbon monoxide dehydrogenase subunit G